MRSVCGLDVHKDSVFLCILCETGEIFENVYGVLTHQLHGMCHDMKKRGVKWYDFVGARINPIPGSKQEGIQRFKSRFGGELKIGYLWKYSISPLKVRLYQTYIKLKNSRSHSYTKDIIDQENSADKKG